MSSQPVVATDQRQREVRARALDENFDAQRRQIGERVAVMFRWIFLAVLTALVNLTAITSTSEKVTVDIALGVWAAMNVVVTLLLIRGFRPGRQFSLTTMTTDIFFASTCSWAAATRRPRSPTMPARAWAPWASSSCS